MGGMNCPDCDGEGIINTRSIDFEKLRSLANEADLAQDSTWTLNTTRKGKYTLDILPKKLLLQCRTCTGTSKKNKSSFKATFRRENVRIYNRPRSTRTAVRPPRTPRGPAA